MSTAEILNELPKLTEAERQLLLGKLLELEDLPLSQVDEVLVASRLADHHANPGSSVPLEEMKRRIRSSS